MGTLLYSLRLSGCALGHHLQTSALSWTSKADKRSACTCNGCGNDRSNACHVLHREVGWAVAMDTTAYLQVCCYLWLRLYSKKSLRAARRDGPTVPQCPHRSGPRASSYSRRRASSTSAACPSGLTVDQIRRIVPPSSMRKVIRFMPMTVRPRTCFSPQAP